MFDKPTNWIECSTIARDASKGKRLRDIKTAKSRERRAAIMQDAIDKIAEFARQYNVDGNPYGGVWPLSTPLGQLGLSLYNRQDELDKYVNSGYNGYTGDHIKMMSLYDACSRCVSEYGWFEWGKYYEKTPVSPS